MLTNTYANTDLTPAMFPDKAEIAECRLPVGVDFPKGKVLGCVAVARQSAVKTITITGTPDGGTWTFALAGQSSGAIAYNAAAAAVQTEVDAMFGSGNCTVTGGPGPGTAWVLTFANALANIKINNLTVTNSLTGGSSPAIAVTDTTVGSSGAGQMDAYDDALSNGTQVARAVLKRAFKSDVWGGNQNENGATGQQANAVAYFGGYFNVSELTGLDANGLADLGRMVRGTAYNSSGGVIKIT